jgi:putative ABC transport system substrate-binding protein
MKRREFITLLGSAAMWPLAASAQELPVIGFVSSTNTSPQGMFARLLAAFHQGLNEGGFVEGRNVLIEYRWAGGHIDQLPELLADLIQRDVKLIVASGGLASALHAKAATKTIPILFNAAFDPVKLGLAASLAQPGGNSTGVTTDTIEMGEKRLEWLHKLLPEVRKVGALHNPKSTAGVVSLVELRRLTEVARSLGLELIGLSASTESDFETAFATAVDTRIGGLLVNGDPFFTSRRVQIIALAARYRLPTIFTWREYVEDGGLISYGPNLALTYRLLGNYAGRILKGEKPGNLPVQRPLQYELLINLKTVKTLGLTVPRILAAAATEFIE